MNYNSIPYPSPTSVRVTHAPGGNSSLSLGWESSRPQKPAQPSQLNPQKKVMVPFEDLPSSYVGSFNTSGLSLSDSNKLLEEQLLYYQRKNKMLRENIFGGVDNLARIQQYSRRAPHFNLYSNPRTYSHPEEKFESEQLELALQDRERKREKERGYSGGYGSLEQRLLPNGEKSSVRVSLPPGGRSSIVFG